MSTQRSSRLPRGALEGAFELAASQVADGTLPFVTLGVADSHGVIRLESFGPVDGPRIGVDAVCLLASVTKPIVATAILREVEAGRVDLTGALAGSLPELASGGVQPFSAWHVLTHTSGFGDVDIERLLLEGGDREELLRRAHALPQETAPGSAFRYASTTFDVLVEALERRLGRPLEAIVRDGVLDPLGMADTSFTPAPDAGRAPAPVRVELPGLAGVPAAALLQGYTRLRLAGGGLWSTAGDLLRFGRAMLRGGELDGARILSPAFVAQMTREVTVGGLGAATDVLRAEHYAVGWGKPGVASPASPSAFGHGGATGISHTPLRKTNTRSWAGSIHRRVPVAPIDAVQGAVYAALP